MRETKPKTFVFVLMPFSETFADTYEVGIKSACKDAGAYCERVDEQIFVENILERVYNQIAKADIIVAEMTGRNPNVFYEVGYAHALNKRVILLTQNADDIPFDLKQFPHIVYGGKIATLKSLLESRIKWCIENPIDSLSRVDLHLQFSIDGMPLMNKHDIIAISSRNLNQGTYFSFDIDVHNLTKNMVDPQSFSLALITPRIIRLEAGPVASVATLSNSQIICDLMPTHTIFPSGWASLHIGCRVKNEEIKDRRVEMILRVFTQLGPTDYPFTLELNLIDKL
jgi:hypothetical protein